MIVFHHHHLERDQALLSDRNWKQVNYYELSCSSELWGSAFMMKLHKSVSSSADEAIIYLLERMAIEQEGWEEASLTDLHIIDFGSFIVSSGYLSKADGWEIPADHFMKNFNEVKEGIFKEKESALYKNGIEVPKDLALEEEELGTVICFADRWNNRQYFTESRDEWILFTWATSV